MDPYAIGTYTGRVSSVPAPVIGLLLSEAMAAGIAVCLTAVGWQKAQLVHGSRMQLI